MNFDLDTDDRALQHAIRDVCRRVFSIERVREMTRIPRDAWKALGDAGVFSLALPEGRGGAGLGMAQAVIVFEELGRALVPGPLVACFLAAELDDEIAKGDRIAGLVEEQAGSFIEHAESLDVVYLVTDRRVVEGSPEHVLGDVVVRPLDPLTPVHRVRDLAPWTDTHPSVSASAWRVRGATLTAALALGIASAATESATMYAKERVQFGRVIGSFQAVKHMLADMLVRAEVARAAVYAAGCAYDELEDPWRAAAAAKVLACEAALANAKTSIQVHGGMGYTWEMDAHLYLKRAAVLATHFGSSEAHAEALYTTL